MSDLDEIELDITSLNNEILSLKSLEKLKKKYIDNPKLVEKIQNKINEKKCEK